MKKLLLSILIAATFVACNSKQETPDRAMVVLQDSSALYQSNMLTDRAAIEEAEEAEYVAPVAKKKNVVAKAPAKKSTYKAPVYRQEPVQERYEAPVVVTPPANVPAESSTAGTGSADAGTGTTGTEVAKEAEKKTGISKAAKGAIIGAGAGAVGGAILGKNAKGAVIGAVLGAGGGYVLGRKQDKKDGRY